MNNILKTSTEYNLSREAEGLARWCPTTSILNWTQWCQFHQII